MRLQSDPKWNETFSQKKRLCGITFFSEQDFCRVKSTQNLWIRILKLENLRKKSNVFLSLVVFGLLVEPQLERVIQYRQCCYLGAFYKDICCSVKSKSSFVSYLDTETPTVQLCQGGRYELPNELVCRDH